MEDLVGETMKTYFLTIIASLPVIAATLGFLWLAVRTVRHAWNGPAQKMRAAPQETALTTANNQEESHHG